MSSDKYPPEFEKVGTGIYRVGAHSIRKHSLWSVYHHECLLPGARFDTLWAAAWWSHHNQPKDDAS